MTITVTFKLCDADKAEFGNAQKTKDDILNGALTLDELREFVGECDECQMLLDTTE